MAVAALGSAAKDFIAAAGLEAAAGCEIAVAALGSTAGDFTAAAGAEAAAGCATAEEGRADCRAVGCNLMPDSGRTDMLG